MDRKLVAAIVCAVLLSTVFVAVNASSGGSETGTFPNRVFSVNRVDPWSIKDVSYHTMVMPTASGDWWVELSELRGSYVLVQVYLGSAIRGKPMSSSDLRTIGDESKKTFMSMGEVYTVAFTCYGKRASATLLEHFDPQVQYTPHAPILIQGNSQFTAENGVVSGDGSLDSPYVISGWEIDASSGIDGIRLEFTSAYFVIRDCYVHSAGEMYMAVYLYFASNGVVQDCVLSSSWYGLCAFVSSSLEIRSVDFDQNLWAGCVLMDCTDCYFIGNHVETDHQPAAEDWGLQLIGCERIVVESNTFDDVGIGFYGTTRANFGSHTITPDNTIGGLPIVYIAGQSIVSVVGEQYAQLIIVCSTNVHVMGMVMSGYTPLYLAYVDYGTIENCEFVGVIYTALELFRCSELLICNNWFHDNRGGSDGLVVVDESPRTVILDNAFERAQSVALNVMHSSIRVYVLRNTISSCAGGISLLALSDALVKWNEVSYCVNGEAVVVFASSSLTIEANSVEGNLRGIFLDESSMSNRIFHNDFTGNAQQAVDRSNGGNSWDDGIRCGNYWSDYVGSDADGNGIGDSPYEIDEFSRDNFPMMLPWSGAPPGGLSPHSPIRILSDSEFTPQNGVTGGSGIESNPYIIEGWYIDATCANLGGIQISFTQSYFIVRNVEVLNGMGYVTNNGIHMYKDMHAVSVENAKVGSNSIGILVSDCPGVTISGNVASNNEMGILVAFSAGAAISGNTVVSNSRWGIVADSCDGVTISGNSASQNEEFGIVALNTAGASISSNHVTTSIDGLRVFRCDNIAITSNTIDSSPAGIRVTECSTGTIAQNIISGIGTAGDACISLWESSYFSVEENTLSGGMWGFWMSGGSYCTIGGNDARNNLHGIGTMSEYGSSGFPPMLGIVISGNTVADNQGLGIRVAATCQGGVISGNIVSGNLGDGITVESGVGTVVKDNIVTDNIGSGLTVRFLTCYGTQVFGNEFAGNGIGVSLEYSGSVTIYGNDFDENTIQACQDPETTGAIWDDGASGNYWWDYTGDDGNGDGIGDTPYLIDATHMDRYPLMSPCVP